MTTLPGTHAITISAPPGSNFPQPQDLSVTPGGTIYATTPGGTRIVYDRNALLFLRNSPLSKTPPTNMTSIPGVTAVAELPKGKPQKPKEKSQPIEEPADDEMFKME